MAKCLWRTPHRRRSLRLPILVQYICVRSERCERVPVWPSVYGGLHTGEDFEDTNVSTVYLCQVREV